MEHAAIQSIETPTGIPTGKFGMWVFLVSEIMFFTGLMGSYIVLRLGSAIWPHPGETLNTGLLAVNTLVLITSSLTMALALNAAQQGRQVSLKRFLLATALLGLTFLGIKGCDYLHMWHQGFTIASSLFGSCYYLLTGFHALHVFSGVIVISYLFKAAASPVLSQTTVGRVAAASGSGTTNLVGRVEYSGLYWHFIDIVWVILFAILCLV